MKAILITLFLSFELFHCKTVNKVNTEVPTFRRSDIDFPNYDVTEVFWGGQPGLNGTIHEDTISTFLPTLEENIVPVITFAPTPEEMEKIEPTPEEIWPFLKQTPITLGFTWHTNYPGYPYEPPPLDDPQIYITQDRFPSTPVFNFPDDPGQTTSFIPETEGYEILNTTSKNDSLTNTTSVTELPGSAVNESHGDDENTTTTMSPAKQRYYEMMETRNEGYLPIFLAELLRITIEKDENPVKELLREVKPRVFTWYETDRPMWLGEPLAKVIVELSRFISESEVDYVKSSSAMMYQMLKDRKTDVAEDINSIIEDADRMYTEDEGEQLFDALVEYEQYPNGTKNATQLCEFIFDSFMRPYIRLGHCVPRQMLLDSINTAFAKRHPSRRSIESIFKTEACTNTLQQQQPKNSSRNVNLALEAVLEFDNKDPGDIPLLDNIKKLIDNLKDAMRDNKRRYSRRSLRKNTDYLGTLNHKIIKRLNYLEEEIHELKQVNSLKGCPTNDKNQTVQCLTRGSSGRNEKPDEARKRSLMKGFNISDNMSDLKCDKCNATRIYRKVLKTNMTEVKKTISSDQTSHVRLKSDKIFMTTSNMKLHHGKTKPHHHHHHHHKKFKSKLHHTTAKPSHELEADQRIFRSNDTSSLNEKQVTFTPVATETTSTANLSPVIQSTNKMIRYFNSTFPLDDSYVSKDDRKYEHKTKTSTAEMSNELSDTNFISHRAKDWARITRGLEFSSPPHYDIFHPSKVW